MEPMGPPTGRSDYTEAIRRYLANQGIGAFGSAISSAEHLDELAVAKKAMAALAEANGQQMGLLEFNDALEPYLQGTSPMSMMEISPERPDHRMNPPAPPPTGDGSVGGVPFDPLGVADEARGLYEPGTQGLLEAIRRRREMERKILEEGG